MTLTYPDLMIDIETLATTNDAVIVQIGWVEFNIGTGELRKPQSILIEYAQGQNQRRIDPETLRWWMKQGTALRVLVSASDRVSLDCAKASVEELCAHKERLWAKEPSFDFSILRHAGFNLGSFRKERSVRTIMDLGDMIGVPERPFEGVPHDSGCDAAFQALCMIDVFGAIRKTTPMLA